MANLRNVHHARVDPRRPDSRRLIREDHAGHGSHLKAGRPGLDGQVDYRHEAGDPDRRAVELVGGLNRRDLSHVSCVELLP